MRHRMVALLLGLLVVGVALAYVTAALDAGGEGAVAPLDDAYITYQYARQIARGQWLRYNDGDAPTGGMTSLLYGLLLAALYPLAGDAGLPAVAVALGAVWLPLVGWLTWRIARRLLPADAAGPWAWAAAALVVLNGAVQWACFNGMETGLFTVLSLATLDAFLRRRLGRMALWAGLAAMTRPGGLVLVATLCVVSLPGLLRGRGVPSSAHRGTPRYAVARPLGALSLALLAGLLPMALTWALTGDASSSGLQSKSWFGNVPAYPDAIARSILDACWRILIERYVGWETPERWFLPPGLLALAFVGWGHLAHRRQWSALAASLVWVGVGSFFTATAITAFWHLGRYQVPFIPLFVAAAACGLAALDGANRASRGVAVAATGLLLSLSLYTTWSYIGLYRESLDTVVEQQVAVASWVREHTPPDARVGVHDAGVIRYLGGRPTYDLVGLTTDGAAIAWRNGPGSVFEEMERSPARPEYMAIYPDRYFLPNLADTDLYGQRLYCAAAEDPVVASAGPVQCVWRIDWAPTEGAGRPRQPDILARLARLTPSDRLDVADLRDEAAHGVVWWNDVRRAGFATEAQQMRYHVGPPEELLDGGRLVTGGMTFRMRTEPGRPLWLVARLHARERGAMRVEVGGVEVGRWAYPALPDEWLETLLAVPAEAVTATDTEITLRVEPDVPGFQHLALYHLWAYQGEPAREPVTPSVALQAQFGPRIALVGLDLPKGVWPRGGSVPVTLYWRAVTPTTSDDRVFLHLYDTAGKLRAQVDGWAYHDTRPPYTWAAGETVADPRQLALPEDLPPGRYRLEVGVYDLANGARLPASVDGVTQPEGRVRLAEIEVAP